MLWNGNVGVSPDGLDWVAICRWNRIVRIARTMMEVSIPTRVRQGTSAARHECDKARVRQGTSVEKTLYPFENFFDERLYNDTGQKSNSIGT